MKAGVEKEPVFTAVLPAYRMGSFIGAALDSVGKQTYPHWEAIVVDDAGPEDGTREIVEAFARAHPDHRVKQIRHDQNAGVSAARNTAIKEARGEVIALLDPDDAWKPEHLQTHAEIFSLNPDVVLSYSQADTIDENGALLAKPTGFHNFHGVAGKGTPGKVEDGYFQAMMVAMYVPVSTACLRRDILLAIGGFQEDVQYQVEDWVMWARVGKRGSVHFTEQPTAFYRIHPQGFSNRQSLAGAIDNHIEFVFMVGDHEGRGFALSKAMERITTRALNYPQAPLALRLKFAAKVFLQCCKRGWWRQALASADAWKKFFLAREAKA